MSKVLTLFVEFLIAQGYMIAMLLSFSDKDLCAVGLACQSNSECLNQRGSSTCICVPGFQEDDSSCHGRNVYTLLNLTSLFKNLLCRFYNQISKLNSQRYKSSIIGTKYRGSNDGILRPYK